MRTCVEQLSIPSFTFDGIQYTEIVCFLFKDKLKYVFPLSYHFHYRPADSNETGNAIKYVPENVCQVNNNGDLRY